MKISKKQGFLFKFILLTIFSKAHHDDLSESNLISIEKVKLPIISPKTITVKKTNPNLRIFARLMLFICFHCQKLFHSVWSSKSPTKSVSSSSAFFGDTSTKFAKFIKLLILTQRAIKTMRNRTKFRPLKNVRERVLEVLDDQSYFRNKSQNRVFSFIKNKAFRKAIIRIKRFFHRNFAFLETFSSYYLNRNFL